MKDTSVSSRPLQVVAAIGVLCALAGALWWIGLVVSGAEPATSLASAQRVTATAISEPTTTASPATAAPPREFVPVALSTPVLFDDDLGTGSSEFSAVTLNEDTHRLIIADDEGKLFEFDLDDGGVPIVPARRTIDVQFDDRDLEGIAWIGGNAYVLAQEETGRLSVVDIGTEQTMLSESDVQRTIDTQTSGDAGNGIEGVSSVESIDDVEFLVVVETPPRLLFIDDDGLPATSQVLQLGSGGEADVSDVVAAADGSVWVVSDTGRALIRFAITGDDVDGELQQFDLVFPDGRFEQPEGVVVSRDGSRLYVVGESPGTGQYVVGLWYVS